MRFHDQHSGHGHRHHWHAAGRHGWRRSGWGSDEEGRGGRRRRVFDSGELRLILLKLIADQPRHGYELIRAIEELSGGFYAPSPGVIYPSLTYLEEIGHAEVEAEGNRKLYRITDAGKQHLEANRTNAEAILEALTRIAGRMEEVREAFAGVEDMDPDASEELHRARHALKHALKRKHGSAPEEARRIAKILSRAAAEIAGGREQPK